MSQELVLFSPQEPANYSIQALRIYPGIFKLTFEFDCSILPTTFQPYCKMGLAITNLALQITGIVLNTLKDFLPGFIVIENVTSKVTPNGRTFSMLIAPSGSNVDPGLLDPGTIVGLFEGVLGVLQFMGVINYTVDEMYLDATLSAINYPAKSNYEGSTRISGLIRNAGNTEATFTPTVMVAGDILTGESVTLQPNGETPFSITFIQPASAAQGTVFLNDEFGNTYAVNSFYIETIGGPAPPPFNWVPFAEIGVGVTIVGASLYALTKMSKRRKLVAAGQPLPRSRAYAK